MENTSVDKALLAGWPALIKLLGGRETIAALAYDYGAFHRARVVKNPETLLRLILAYAPGRRSLRMTAAEAAARGIADVSDVALLKRFRQCGDWLTVLCERLLPDPDPQAAGRFEHAIRLVDGSRIAGPGSTCWRLHLSYDPGRARIADFAVTPMEQGENLNRLSLQPGEIYLADRGYPKPAGLYAAIEAKADVLVRATWNSLKLLDAKGEALDWLALFNQATQDGVDMPVTLEQPKGASEPLALRLLILPKPKECIEAARKAVRDAARKDQRKIDPRTLRAAEYMILVTSLDQSTFPPGRLATLYRLRWQIELAFKRLKSILKIDRLPAKDPGLARTWITAHLLIALLIERTVDQIDDIPPSDDPSTTCLPMATDRRPRQSRH